MTSPRSTDCFLTNCPGRALFSSIVLTVMLGFAAPVATPAETSTADKAAAISKAKALTPSAGTSEDRPSLNDEVVALRAQLDVMRQYDQRLLATVYWSLTVVATLVLALITIIGFLNLRVYERDKAALRQELVGLLREEFGRSEQTLRKDLTDFQEEVRTQATRNYEALTGSVKETVQPLLNPVTQEIKNMRKRLLEIEYNQAENNVMTWMKQGVWSNALQYSLELLDIALRFNWDWRISEVVGYMKKALDAILTTKRSIPNAEDAKGVSEAIDKLPPGFSTDAENLRGLLKRVRAL